MVILLPLFFCPRAFFVGILFCFWLTVNEAVSVPFLGFYPGCKEFISLLLKFCWVSIVNI